MALEFKKEMDKKTGRKKDDTCPWDYVMMFLANMTDEGITILPTHRLVKGLKGNNIFRKLESDFAISKLPKTGDFLQTLSKAGNNVFGFYIDREEGWYILKYKKDSLNDIHPALKNLDVVVLHELILKRNLGIIDIAYEMDAAGAIEKIRSGDFDGVFFLNPTKITDVERVAMSHLRMPPKSTYFYPKLLTGMVINSFINNT